MCFLAELTANKPRILTGYSHTKQSESNLTEYDDVVCIVLNYIQLADTAYWHTSCCLVSDVSFAWTHNKHLSSDRVRTVCRIYMVLFYTGRPEYVKYFRLVVTFYEVLQKSVEVKRFTRKTYLVDTNVWLHRFCLYIWIIQFQNSINKRCRRLQNHDSPSIKKGSD